MSVAILKVGILLAEKANDFDVGPNRRDVGTQRRQDWYNNIVSNVATLRQVLREQLWR